MKGLNDLAMWKTYRKMNFIHVVAIGMAMIQIGGAPIKTMASEPAKPGNESAVIIQSEDPAVEINQEGEVSEEKKTEEGFVKEAELENKVTEESDSEEEFLEEELPDEEMEEEDQPEEEELPNKETEEEGQLEEELPNEGNEEEIKPEEKLPDGSETEDTEESGLEENLPEDLIPEDDVEPPTEQQPEEIPEEFEEEYEAEELYMGWNYNNSVWRYYNMKGEMQTGWQKISGKWYYLKSSGEMQTGWQWIKGKWYYLKSSGEMQTGWQKIKGKWYYLKSSGEMQTGWQKIKGKWYYLKSSGEMQTGWQKIKGKWYYLKSSGEMQTGWQELKGKWYYLNKSGEMLTDWQKIGNTWYYFDASGVMRDSGDGPLIFKEGTVFQLNQCSASFDGESAMKITLAASRDSSLEKLGNTFYIVMLNSKGTELLELSEGKITKGGSFQIQASFDSEDSFKTIMMSKYAIAVKKGYSYQVISDVQFLNNPEITVSQDADFKDWYWGYYEGYKVTSKKGIQGVSDAYTEDLRVQHLLLNVDIQDLVWVGKASGYIPYEYKGNTYYFSDLVALKKTIYDLHGWGSSEGNAYGENHTRNVTLVLLMSWKYDALSYLIHPDARDKGAAPYYMLNMKDEKSRETYEALFCYLGEELGQMKVRVNNWTLGNEVNSCNAWNYSGGMSLSECVENYAQAFQLLYQGIRRTASSPRLFISLDHCWNTADAGHDGKAYLDEFAACMDRTAPGMQWNVNYHPYSQPLTNTAFWNDDSSTEDSADTDYISMRNIKVLTDYLTKLESRYGKKSGSIRVILGEVGYSAVSGNKAEEKLQAAALGYGYYIALFNKRIDSYIIRAYMDAPQETAAGLHLGLRRNDNAQTEKESYALFKYLDTGESLKRMNRYQSLIGISNWAHAIPGFDADAIEAEDF